MFKRSLSSPAMIVAFIALFVALGGTGYAAVHLSSSGHHAVASSGKRGPQGKMGPQGQSGPQGPAGPQGGETPAPPEAVQKTAETLTIANTKFTHTKVESSNETTRGLGQFRTVSVACPEGTTVDGGGFSINGNDRNNSTPLKSEPSGNGWLVEATPDNTTKASVWGIKAWADCIS
jgi:hypothetical protein